MAGEIIQQIHVSALEEFGLGIFIASSERGITRVGLTLGAPWDPVEFFAPMFPHTSIVYAPEKNARFASAISGLLRGKDWDHTLPLDFTCTQFQAKVLEATSMVPFGKTRTYGQIARMIGMPKASRAVGQALKINPLPLVFP